MQDWLQIARNQAEERFRSLPFPGGKDENYRFTPVHYEEARAAGAAPGSLPEALSAKTDEDGALLLVEGEEAKLEGQTTPTIFMDMLRAATIGTDSVRALLRDGDAFRDDKFAQLTIARWNNGAFLHVPAGVKLAKPFRFVLRASESEEHFRHIIVLEEGAEATVVQELSSDGSPRFVSELTEIRLGRNAKISYSVLQDLGAGTEAIQRQRLELGEGSELRFIPVHLGGKLVQLRQEVHLAGEDASFESHGAARGDQDQHFDFWIDVRHEASRTRSHMDYWFVMSQKAKGVFNGQVEVKKETIGCDSAQRSKTLLLGSGTVHAIPKLIIKTDEVKASHGASVSTVNPEQLHYLQSRGIPRGEAERMIVRGFTEVVVEKLPMEALRERAEAGLDRKQGGVQ